MASRTALTRIVVPLLLGCLGTACGDVAVRIDAAVVTEDAPALANCPVGCLPPAPQGWVGPTALYDGPESAKPTDCPTPYTQKTAEAHVGMTAAPAACACGASVTTGRRCDADVVTYSLSGCAGNNVLLEGTATTASCLTTTNGTQASYRVETPTLVPGTCTFPNASATLPPVAFEKVEVACGLAQAAACVARTDCVSAPAPAQPFTRMCIHQDGDVPCSSADYSERFVAHKAVSDTRTCSACTATPSGGACGTSWGNRSNAIQCTNLPAPADKTAGICYPYGGIGTVVDVGAMGPSNATCTPTGGSAAGTAASTEPVTFCCAPS